MENGTQMTLEGEKGTSADDGGEQIVLDRSYGIRTIVDYG